MLARLVIALAFAGTTATAEVRPLPIEDGAFAADIAWQNDKLLISTEKGVYLYSATTNAAPVRVVKAVRIPDGIRAPDSLASNGTYSVATALTPPSSYAWWVKNRKRAWAEQMAPVLAFDVALTDKAECILGRGLSAQTDRAVAVSCGGVGDAWRSFKPLHKIRSGEKAVQIFRASILHLAGAIATERDGTLDVITSAEPGLFRYAPDGKLIEVLGANVDELVLGRAHEIADRYAADMSGAYRAILNTQPIIDDVVVTPGGPAIVVRIADGELIRWELWYPSASGDIRERTKLDIKRYGPYGHLRCSARGSTLACVTSLPPKDEAAKLPEAQRYPTLVTLQLAPVKDTK